MDDDDAVAGVGAGTMRAARLHAPDGPAAVWVDRVEIPEPGRGDALIRVHAAAITRDELDWPVDRLPAIPSYEVAGVLHSLGPDTSGPAGVVLGAPVFALTGFDRDGAAADYTVVRAAHLAPKPRALSFVEAAALPMGGLSAWQALFDHGRLTEGQRVLIHGAAGGVGHLAVQIAADAGAHVIGTATGAGVEAARERGAHEVVDRGQDAAWEESIEPVDLVFDTVGGETLARSAALVRPGGRIVSVAQEPPGHLPEGVTGVYFVVEPNGEQLAELGHLADEGRLRPRVDAVVPLDEARSAFERVMAPGKRGKVVLEVRP
jgi:NADPH:quinone reductase-like Zn-dependent oxidoreductase